jgi:hypothetical protein
MKGQPGKQQQQQQHNKKLLFCFKINQTIRKVSYIEETSHLFAECPALCQIRYKTLGHHMLPENYNGTSEKLQDMIREIAKKYPEETPFPRQCNLSQPNSPEP